MSVDPKVVIALKSFRKVRIVMPPTDGLKEGRELVNNIQEACNFQLCYTQRLGENPEVIIWRFTNQKEAMQGHAVPQHQC